MSESMTAGDLRVGDRIVSVNGHPPPGGEPVEVLGLGWSFVNNVMAIALGHDGGVAHQRLHVTEPVEVQR